MNTDGVYAQEFKNTDKEEEEEDLSFQSVFKYLNTKQFYCIFSMNFLSIFFGTYIVGSFKMFAQETAHIYDEEYLTFIGAIASIFGCLRFIWSFLLDYYSYKLIYSSLIALQTILCFMFYI